ncbi:unnamed protein product, partial [Rotaria sp. Silwood1]
RRRLIRTSTNNYLTILAAFDSCYLIFTLILNFGSHPTFSQSAFTHTLLFLLRPLADFNVDENLLNQLKILPHVPLFIILNKADFLQNLFSSQSELEKDIKYFDDINQKDFPNYFRNNHILMVKRECLMKWKINNEDIVNLQHIFLMSLIDEDKTHRPIGVRENII